MRKLKALCGLAACAVMLGQANIAFATVGGPGANGVQGVLSSGSLTDFAKYAPISTITIDLSKSTGIKLDQATPHSNNPNGYYLDNGYVKATGVKMKEGWSTLSSFTIIYENAATLSNGETKNVEVVFGSGQDTQVIGKSGNGSYTDDLTFANTKSVIHNGPAITPLSGNGMHFGLRTNVKVRVGKNGDFPDDTFLFTAFDINISRSGSNFENLVYASANYNYSEAVEPSSGLNSESDIYIPSTYAEFQKGTNSASPSSTYGTRFVGKNGNTPLSQKNYNSGFAAVGSSNGFVARYWSSAGTNTSPIELYLMPDRISHTTKSASSEGGKIELWTSGKIDDNSATRLDGGTTSIPCIYDVPNAKEVTYKMTPNNDYEFDTLMVNGLPETATEVLGSNGEVLYYAYTFDEAVNTDQEIEVTWKKNAVSPTPEPEPEVLTPNTGANSHEMSGFGVSMIGCVFAGMILSLFAVPAIVKRSKRD